MTTQDSADRPSTLKQARRKLYRLLGIKRHTWAYDREPQIDLSKLLGEKCQRVPFLDRINLGAELKRMDIVPRGIIHVGAHLGSEVAQYRMMGFQRILLIEANPELVSTLRSQFASSPDVCVVHAAANDSNGSVSLHVTSMDQSSSILELGVHRKLYPGVRKMRTIQVPARTLDSLFAENNLDMSEFNVMSLDIQGAEMRALRGAPWLLRHLLAVVCEFSTIPLYKGGATLLEIDAFLGALGLNRSVHSTPWHPAWGDALFVRRPALSMRTLGTNGRFANQLFQYAFLRIAADKQRLALQIPDWIGRDLFGLDDPPIVRELPRLVEYGVDGNPEGPFLHRPQRWLHEDQRVNADCDLWGYLQLHGSCWAEHLDHLRRLFTPVPVLGTRLEHCLSHLASIMPQVVAIQIRRGDFGSGPFFRAPSHWFVRWLDQCAPNQPAYLASDATDEVRSRFAGRHMITARDISDMPAELDWLVDFHVLRHAHSLAISNSSFGFMSALLNERRHRTGRACAEAGGIVDFEPTSAPVLLHPALSPSDHMILEQMG